jgi:hypothetical protein
MLKEYNNLPIPNQTLSDAEIRLQAPCPRAEAAIEAASTEIASGRANEINRVDWAQSSGERGGGPRWTKVH